MKYNFHNATIFFQMKSFFLLCSLLLAVQTSAQTRQVTDDLNRTVTLVSPAQRIISLAPHLSELVFSAGAGEKLIGVSRHCDYPPTVLDLPKVADYQNINFEEVALLQADLILVWNAGLKNTQLELLDRIADQVYVSSPKTPADIADNLAEIGILAGTADIAQRRADAYLTDIQALARRYQRTQSVPVMYLLWEDPPMTVNRRHWISQFIDLCGGQNLYADAPVEIVRLNQESMLLNHAQLILHSIPKGNIELLTKIPAIYISENLIQRPTLRSIQGITQICEAIAMYGTSPN